MAVGDKKDMKAVMKINPWAEMKKHQKEWFQENFSKNRKVQMWSYERKAKLDPREWDANKLDKAIKALVRYECVLFASRTEEWIKKISKAKDQDKVLKEAQQKLPGYFLEIHKKMTLKMDKAMDELEQDKGDNKEAIGAGKEMFDKFKELDAKEIYDDVSDDVVQAMAELSKALGKAGEDAEKKEAAMSAAASSLKSIETAWRGVIKTKSSVVKELNTKAAKMSKDKKSDPTMQKIGLQVTRLKSDTKKVLGDMAMFQKELKQLYGECFDEKIDERRVKMWADRFKAGSKLYSGAATLQNKISPVKKTYKAAASKLK